MGALDIYSNPSHEIVIELEKKTLLDFVKEIAIKIRRGIAVDTDIQLFCKVTTCTLPENDVYVAKLMKMLLRLPGVDCILCGSSEWFKWVEKHGLVNLDLPKHHMFFYMK